MKWEQHRLRTGPTLFARAFGPTKEMHEISPIKMQASEVLRTSVESLQSIDEMELSDLKDAIPNVRQAVAKIDALAQHIQEPGSAFH